MRRANRTGCITKLSGKRRNPYIAKFNTSTDDDGHRYWTIVGYYRTKAEASEALAKFSLNPEPMSVSNITFKEVFDEYFRAKSSSLSKSGKKNYKSACNHFQAIWNTPIRNLRTRHYQAVLDACNLKKTTLVLYKSVMVSVCNYAMANDIILKNYASFTVVGGGERAEKQVFTDDEIKLLFQDGSEYAKMLLMLIYSGMRIAELLSLTLDNVHLDERYVVGGVKTEHGKGRVIPIHLKTLPFWEEAVNNAQGDRLYTITYSTVLRQVTELEERLGMEHKPPHCARHTCASLMARNKVDTIAIKNILGHANYSFTANVYTHVDAKQLVSALDKI